MLARLVDYLWIQRSRASILLAVLAALCTYWMPSREYHAAAFIESESPPALLIYGPLQRDKYQRIHHELLEGPVVRQQALELLAQKRAQSRQPSQPAARLHYKAGWVGQSELLRVTCIDLHPQRAADHANAVADAFMMVTSGLMTDQELARLLDASDAIPADERVTHELRLSQQLETLRSGRPPVILSRAVAPTATQVGHSPATYWLICLAAAALPYLVCLHGLVFNAAWTVLTAIYSLRRCNLAPRKTFAST